MLKQIELTGFKSFGKKSSLDFGSSVSAIVGPNGSGKSNVAEAFRWVLGEQSMKSLRGKRGEDLIWNGSSDVPRVNHAFVTLTFDNRGKIFPIDFDEVSFARHVYRDGVNEYSVNGSRVRLKEMVELLSAVGVGSSSHHIVSQGDADRILSASSVDRREMIEEALGLKMYEYKREESERKLAKALENMREVELLRKEIAPHLRFLKKQIEKGAAQSAMRNELRALYGEYVRREGDELARLTEELVHRREAPTQELSRIDDELAAHVLVDNGSGDLLCRERVADIERELNGVRREVDELCRIAGRLEGRLEAIPPSRDGAVSSICAACGQAIGSDDRDRLAHVEKEALLLHEQLAATHEQLVSVRAKESLLRATHEEACRAMEREERAQRDADRAFYSARARRTELVATLSIQQAEEEVLQIRRNRFDAELQDAERLLGTTSLGTMERVADGETPVLLEPIPELLRRIEKIKYRLEEALGDTVDVEKEYREVSERDTLLSRELSDLAASIASLREVLAELTARLASEFASGLAKINEQFRDFFALMFDGGVASLELVRHTSRRLVSDEDHDSERDNEKEGVEVAVNLPRKKIRSLEMLSGGERSLTSIALVFALSRVNPPPFMVLDETDAALDESNSRRFGDMLELLSRTTQLIVITHNRATMSRANVLYGITMGASGVSRMLSIKFDEAEGYAK